MLFLFIYQIFLILFLLMNSNSIASLDYKSEGSFKTLSSIHICESLQSFVHIFPLIKWFWFSSDILSVVSWVVLTNLET